MLVQKSKVPRFFVTSAADIELLIVVKTL